MTNVRRPLLIGVTVGVIVGAGVARIYYRGLPSTPPAPQSSPSVDPLQASKQRVAVELRDALAARFQKYSLEDLSATGVIIIARKE
jgi:hypothetical protein